MQQNNSNFMNMVQAVVANLRNDYEYIKDEPEIVVELNNIETEVNAINQIDSTVSGLEQKGHTTEKNNSFDSIMASTLTVCKKTCVFARRTNNEVLILLVDHSLNTLSKGKEKDAISRCLAIVNKASSILEQLQPFKVTGDELESIHDQINTYNSKIDERSNVQTEKTTSIQEINDKIRSVRNRLIILDEMIEGFIENQEVVARYKSARIIHNYGKSKTSKNKKA